MNRKDKKIYEKTKEYLEKRNEEDIDKKMKTVEKVLKIEDYEKRIECLYDLICDYLDDKFKNNCICDFKNNICASRRDLMTKKKKDTYINGCCHSYMRNKDCVNLGKDGRCKTRNIGCKLFTCSYLKKKGYKFKLNEIYLARYFLNFRQKYYIECAFYIPREEVIKGILKRKRPII